MESRAVVRRTAIAAAVLLSVVVAAIVFSPYRERDAFDYRLLRQSVEVDAPCERVFAYLGDSRNATDWSVFVDHIVPLNADRVADGARGSIRRSFRNADETGMRWDEDFVEVEPARRRRLRIYNVQDVALRADADLLTEQLYEPLPGGRCRVAFTLFFDEAPSLADHAKMILASYRFASIFRSNLENVKRIVEAGAGRRGVSSDVVRDSGESR